MSDAGRSARAGRAGIALVAGILLGGAVLAAPCAASAPGALGSPLATVRTTLTRSDAIVTAPGDHNAKLAALKGLLRGFLDTDALGRKSMGKHLDGKSPEQVRIFLDLFRELFIRTYVQRLLLFDAPGFEYGDEKVTGDTATVATWIVTPRDKFATDYRMEKKTEGWLATDIFIEDVSLADNFKSQFDRALAKDSFDELIKRLQAKLATKSDGSPD